MRLPNSLNDAARVGSSPRSSTLPVIGATSGVTAVRSAGSPEISISPVPSRALRGAMNTGVWMNFFPRPFQRA